MALCYDISAVLDASGLKYASPNEYGGHRLKATRSVQKDSGKALWLGLDTGGTYTDAVLLADGSRVIASAKSLTTHWDLAVGIGDAIRSVLLSLPEGTRP